MTLRIDIKNAINENNGEEAKFKGGSQKDWIVSSKDMRNLFCIAIVNTGKGWYLWEFVNLFDKSVEKIQEAVNMGYDTMFKAIIGRNKYEYVIADHTFNKDDINTDYWHNLVPNDKFYSKATLEKNKVKIDKDEFEKQMNLLVKNISYTGKHNA